MYLLLLLAGNIYVALRKKQEHIQNFILLVCQLSCSRSMANRKLERLGVDSSVCQRLSVANITTVRELLTSSPLVLMLITGVDMKEVNALIALISEKIASQPQNALMAMHSRMQKARHLSSGVDLFDKALKGGLLVGSISEICGAPGAGKTQFCLSCTLQAVVSAPQSSSTGSSGSRTAGVVYIDTELKFDPNRLIQMAIERYPERYSSEFRTDAPHQIDSLLEQIKVQYVKLSDRCGGGNPSKAIVVHHPTLFGQVKRPTTMKELQDELALLQSSVIAQNVSLVSPVRVAQ